MTISLIEIRNIKGISHECFKVQLNAHKPNLVVAPNGFGKSSVATAFSSMNANRIALAEKDYHKENDKLISELSITVDGQKLTADNTKNEIRQQFDVLVISSGLIPKAKKHFKGAVSSAIEVRPITICKIPTKAKYPYKLTDIKANFGINGKILSNISGLFQDPRLLSAINDIDLSKVTQARNEAAIGIIIEKVNQQTGTADAINQWITDNCLDELRSAPILPIIAQRLFQNGIANSEVEGFFSAYQIAKVYSANPKAFFASTAWLQYQAVKANYEYLLSDFRTSNWQWAKVEENKKKKELLISFPQAHQLSNGQRDIITLVVQLHKTLYEGSKKPLILVIDEVFDYLDDANLVAFQYYTTSIIEAYKQRNQIIYPIILTHLDPGVFFDFCFNKHKIQINYLQSIPVGKSQDSLRLIAARDNEVQIKERLEMYWFHFHVDKCEIPEQEWPRNIPQAWRSCETFHNYTQTELNRYLRNRGYDSIAVCFAVRNTIEKLCYEMLAHAAQKSEFLTTKKTKNKMDFVTGIGIDIPESYFLLGLIYNTNLHWSQGRDYVSPLVSKLRHPTIRRLIAQIAAALDKLQVK